DDVLTLEDHSPTDSTRRPTANQNRHLSAVRRAAASEDEATRSCRTCLRLAHRLEERLDVSMEDVLFDERLLAECGDPLHDGVLVGRELGLVVDADRDRVVLVAARDR